MGILDLVFPKLCLECGKEGAYICAGCLAKVRYAKPICPYCEKASIDGVTHIKCARKLGLNGLTSIWEYEGVVRKAILTLKYKYSTKVGLELSDIFAGRIHNSRFLIPNSAVLVPIPLYWHRENTRGFNQSVEIGKVIANVLNLKFEPDMLIRKKQTTPQVELSGDARRQNLRGVFSLNPNYSLLAINYSVILFDDVFTTGSTLREAAKVLKRAGVAKVWGLTIAR